MNLQFLGNPSLRAIPPILYLQIFDKVYTIRKQGTNVGDQPLMWQATHKKEVPNSTKSKTSCKIGKESA